MAPAWLAIFFILAFAIIWKTAHQYIVSFVFKIMVVQSKLITVFYQDPRLNQAVYDMQTVNPVTIDWSQFITLISIVGEYLRYPVIGVLVILAAVIYFSDIKLKFKHIHDMKSLRLQEQGNWTCIMPVISQDLVATDINKGPWAMALTPMEFARRYNLLKKDDPVLDKQVPGLEMTAGIRRGDAKRVFTLQLGPYFDGFEHVAPHVMALAAAFMARINRDRGSASLIIDTLNKTWPLGKPNYSIAKPILKKYEQTELVQEIISGHAYVLTVMASLIQAARADGVVASADFLWLKPTDRRLWYMLNCVGRQTPYAEVGGAFAHWRAEKVRGRRSQAPMIDEAIKALEVAIKAVKLTPKEMQELTL